MAEASAEPGLPEVVHHLPGIHDPRVTISDADALIAERDELRTAIAGATRKLDKLLSFVDAGRGEIERLGTRLAEVDRELAGLAGGEPDGVER
jgi:hypothetical protein